MRCIERLRACHRDPVSGDTLLPETIVNVFDVVSDPCWIQAVNSHQARLLKNRGDAYKQLRQDVEYTYTGMSSEPSVFIMWWEGLITHRDYAS